MQDEKQPIKGNSFFVSRDLFNHWIGSRATWTAMWVKLLGLAKWKDNSKLKAGQAEININDLSFLDVSTKQIRDFLKRLIESGEVTVESRTGNRYVKSTMIITILKWDEYQVVPEKDVTSRASLGHLKGISKPVTTAKSLENKDTNKEEGIKNKKDTVGGHQQVVDYIWVTYENKYSEKPPADKGLFVNIARLTKQYGVEKMKKAWDRYLSSDDPFFSSKQHPPQMFIKAGIIIQFLTEHETPSEKRAREDAEYAARSAELSRSTADSLRKRHAESRRAVDGNQNPEGR